MFSFSEKNKPSPDELYSQIKLTYDEWFIFMISGLRDQKGIDEKMYQKSLSFLYDLSLPKLEPAQERIEVEKFSELLDVMIRGGDISASLFSVLALKAHLIAAHEGYRERLVIALES